MVLSRLLRLLLVLLALGAWTTIGINFRATAGYVTDGANQTYCLGTSDTYPQPRGGATFGYTSVNGDASRDRSTGVDVRLAGQNQQPNDGTQSVWKLDLTTSGPKTICLALGDENSTQGYQYIQVLDDTTVLFTITDTDGTANDKFDDANGTEWSGSAWPGSNTCRTVTFATTTLVFKLGATSSQSGSSTIAHLSVTDAGGSSSGSAANLHEDY